MAARVLPPQVDQLVAELAGQPPLDVQDPGPAFRPLGPLGHVGHADGLRDDLIYRHAQVIDGSGEGRGEPLLPPDPVEVDALGGPCASLAMV